MIQQLLFACTRNFDKYLQRMIQQLLFACTENFDKYLQRMIQQHIKQARARRRESEIQVCTHFDLDTKFGNVLISCKDFTLRPNFLSSKKKCDCLFICMQSSGEKQFNSILFFPAPLLFTDIDARQYSE